MRSLVALALAFALAAIAMLTTASTAGAQAGSRGPRAGRVGLVLDYDGKLMLKVLEISIEQRASDQAFATTARLRSYGVLSLFRKVDNRSTAEGKIAGGHAFSHAFHSQNVDGRSNRRVAVVWTGNDVVTEAQPAYNGHLGDPPASRAQRLEAVDPLTALMRVALTDDEAELCRGVVHFFDGKQRYDIDFLGRQTAGVSLREQRLGLTRPIHCQMRFREVAGFSRKPPGERNQGLKHPVTIGFAQVGRDGPWVISYMDAETPLGRARVELERVRTVR
jgi:hypothetical protein